MNVDDEAGLISFSMGESDGMSLLEFIQWGQAVTGKRFTFDARELGNGAPAANVHFVGTFRLPRATFREDFYSFFQTMLYIKGFAVIPRGEGDLELLEIVMMTGMRGREVSNGASYVAPDDLSKYRFQAGVPILTSVPLKHINAQLANNALRPFFASTGGSNAGGSVQIGNVGNSTSLLLQSFGPQVHAAVQLLKLVDTPDGEANLWVQVVVLEHQDPETILPIVADALASLPAVGKPERVLATAAATVAIAAPAPVAPAPDTPVEQDDDSMVFSMKEQDGMALVDFIKWGQEVTGKRFTFNSQELAGGKVDFIGTFRFPRATFREDFYSFFQTMLYIKGFAVIPRGEGDLELLEIVMMAGTRGREISNGSIYVEPEQIGNYRYQAGVSVLTTVQLGSINAQLACNALRPFFASTGGSNSGGSVQIGTVGNKSALLLQGFGPQVYAAVELLKLVDQPSESRADGLRVVADAKRKALVLSGTQEQVRVALDLVARLDVAGVEIERIGRLIFVNKK